MVARRFGPEEERELVKRYEAGEPQSRLAAEYMTSHVTVRNTLRRAGVTLRGPGSRAQPLTSAQEAEVCERYRRGESQAKIARSMGTSDGKVTRALRAAGLYTQRGAKFGQKHPLWKGGRVRASGGYVLVKVDPDDVLARAMAQEGSYVMEHRLVMARQLGRPLESGETVHHLNGDKADNRIENLQLRNGNHGKGMVYTCRDCGSRNVDTRRL